MLSLQYIEAEAKRAARTATRLGRRPVAIGREDLTPDGFVYRCSHMPVMGTPHNHKAHLSQPALKWVSVRDYLPDYPHKMFFVDSSGMGSEGESALTGVQLCDKLSELCAKYGFIFYLGIAEVGEFQAHVALYIATPKKPRPYRYGFNDDVPIGR